MLAYDVKKVDAGMAGIVPRYPTNSGSLIAASGTTNVSVGASSSLSASWFTVSYRLKRLRHVI